MMRKIFLMLASSLLLFASALFFCGGSSAGESKGDLNKKQMDKLNASIEAAYHDQDLQKAVQPFQQLIPLMQAEYGANNVAVGQTRRNFAYLLSSVGMKTESNLQADLAAKILLANGTDVTVGNSRVGTYSIRCPASYEAKCRGGVGDDNSWVSSFDFLDAPVKHGQPWTWRIEVFERGAALAGHFRYSTLKDFLNGCYAEDEVLEHPKPAIINGIKFDRAVVCTITPGDYREKPSKQMSIFYFATVGKIIITLQCHSRVGGFPVTLGLLEPAFRTFKKIN